MPDRALWALMQRVETLRYRAERLERVSESWPNPWRDLAFDVASRWRRTADQLYASGRSRTA
jgi:hypothetical protein